MLIQIPHAGERMVGRWTPSNPAIIRSFTVRIVRTIGLVFHPGLLDLVALTTKETDVPSLDLGGCLNTVLGLLVLTHSLSTGILLTTVRAFNLVTCYTSLCVLSPSPFGGKHLATLTTWKLLTSMHPHVDHQGVVGIEGPLAHRAVLPFPGNSWNLVGDLSNFSGLGTLRQVLPLKKS